MYEIAKFKELLSESVVNDLFNSREDIISHRTVEEKQDIKDLLKEKEEGYKNIFIAVENVPNAFVETRLGIKEAIDTYLETVNCVNGYDNEKFYKIGFCDGVNLIMECLVNKKLV